MDKEKKKVFPKHCPICGVQTNYVYNITDGKEETVWYRCPCGVIFLEEQPKHDTYNDKYVAGYSEYKDADLVQIHAARTYAPLIEELTYGRKMLDVGFCLPYNMDFFKERGWIAKGLEINSFFKDRKDVLCGDFEECGDLKDQFDLIWMSHVFEHFKDPIKALKKAYDLMPENGVLYIATPDIDFISKTGVGSFPHWKSHEHYVMWTERALVRELERVGFNIVMKRRNYSSRFTGWYDVQILCQKNYF